MCIKPSIAIVDSGPCVFSLTTTGCRACIIRKALVLTLLLVLGTVTCSPVPSDLPAIPDAGHVEVTHEVRHVTYEVSAEVNEATASSHIPSDVPPEEDPPIPTVTTPHAAPEEQHTQEFIATDNVGISQPPEIPSDTSVGDTTDHETALGKSFLNYDSGTEENSRLDTKEKSGEALTERRATELENTSKSEKTQEAVFRSSAVTGKLVPESHMYLTSEDINGSHPEIVSPGHEGLPTEVEPTKIVSEVIDVSHSISENGNNDEHTTEASVHLVDDEIKSKSVSNSEQNEEPFEDLVRTVQGNEELPEVLYQDNVEFLETKKRTDSDDVPVHEETALEPVSEAPQEFDIVAPEDNIPETTRESRVYIEDEESTDSESKKEQAPSEGYKSSSEKEQKSTTIGGLESMSMTSPTPESLPDDVPGDVPVIDDLGKVEAPPGEDQEAEVATGLPEMELSEENSTISDDTAKQDLPDIVIKPPSSSIAPWPVEEYTDNYGDPLNSGDLPDFDVTHERLPSVEHPLPKDAQLIPKQTHEHTGDGSKGESSDLAAGDHMLEVEAGTPRVLPPQQEQVSAAAPSSLTPGCIVAIVFGVLVSLVVILGVGGFMIWQRRTQNRPKVLGNDQGYAGSDSGGYIDDQVRVSYVNSQTDTPKGSPEDLISLDNDSFLNSLESMTIQNLWTDNIRHTKL
ncbi:hypothetical protein SK128_025137 [Halocaridina rubra]|uniref:Uncharacterized protein n=1 Tax=Halocaridina rubra TaxID=373956 RepID=A0AAN8XTS6_HALRR